MAQPEQGRIGVVIEKPFGHDLESAVELNHQVNAVFHESQVFRIDHYLGKETVQNILVFRFANGIFEPIWNRNYIDHVQITAAETLGVEGRGPFYEKAGALRDVIQNHVMELMSFVTMEPPSSFDAEAVRREKVKVWRAIPSIPILDAVRGQYGPGVVQGQKVVGYRDEERVNPESGTETYAAVKLQIENWRWAGVPFYLRAGKRMKRRATEISIHFKQPPLLIFNRMQSGGQCGEIQPNLLTIRIQPDEGIALRFGAKVPNTPNMAVCPVNMDFDYSAAFGTSSANGYERLLLDAMLGDPTLFAHRNMDFDYSAAFGTSSANGYERLLLDAMLGDPTLFAHRTEWRRRGHFIRRFCRHGQQRIPRSFPIILRAHGDRTARIACWNGADICGGTIWAGKPDGAAMLFHERGRRLNARPYSRMTFTMMPSGSSPSIKWTTPPLT